MNPQSMDEHLSFHAHIRCWIMHFYWSFLRAPFFFQLHFFGSWKFKSTGHTSKQTFYPIRFWFFFFSDSIRISTISFLLSASPKCVISTEFHFLFIRCDINVISMNTMKRNGINIARWKLFIWKEEKKKNAHTYIH